MKAAAADVAVGHDEILPKEILPTAIFPTKTEICPKMSFLICTKLKYFQHKH
jgi:hypothetical protein